MTDVVNQCKRICEEQLRAGTITQEEYGDFVRHVERCEAFFESCMLKWMSIADELLGDTHGRQLAEGQDESTD